MIAQKSMTVPKQRETCFKLYHGEKEIMGQAEKFIKHSSIYSDVWAVEQSKQGPRYYIPERLHQQYGNMLVGGDNITESLIRRLYEKDMDNMLSGQAIIAKAKEAVKEAKKMNGLMSVAIKEGVLQKVEGGEYGLPSGRSEDDFDLWLLKRVYNWEKYYGASGKQQFNCNTNKISSSNNNDSDIITADEDGDNSGKDGGDGNGKDGGEGDGDDGFVNPADKNDKIQIELPIPHDIFADNELNTSSIADDGSTGSDKDPPQNYLPKGWVLFKTRGPMSFPIENRLDFFSESLSGNNQSNK